MFSFRKAFLLFLLLSDTAGGQAVEKKAKMLNILQNAHTEEVVAMGWGKQGLATGSSDNTLKLWSPGSWQTPVHVFEPGKDIRELSYHPGSPYLVFELFGAVEIWNIRNPSAPVLVQRLKGTYIQSVALNHDGSQLAGGTKFLPRFFQVVYVYDTNKLPGGDDDDAASVYIKTDYSVYSVDLAPDGRLVAVDSKSFIRIWNAKTLTPQAVLVGASRLQLAKWNPTGTLLAAGAYYDGEIQIWRAPADSSTSSTAVWPDKPASSIKDKHAGHIKDLAWSPDGKRLASVSWGKQTTSLVNLWKVSATGILEWEQELTGGHLAGEGGVYSVAWSPDGTQLATGGGDGRVVIWDVATTPSPSPPSTPLAPPNPAPSAPQVPSPCQGLQCVRRCRLYPHLCAGDWPTQSVQSLCGIYPHLCDGDSSPSAPPNPAPSAPQVPSPCHGLQCLRCRLYPHLCDGDSSPSAPNNPALPSWPTQSSPVQDYVSNTQPSLTGGTCPSEDECREAFLGRAVWCNPCLTGGQPSDCSVIEAACRNDYCQKPGCTCRFLAKGVCVTPPSAYTPNYWACVPDC